MKSKQTIVSVIVAILLLGGVGWKYYEYKYPDIVKTEYNSEQPLGNESNTGNISYAISNSTAINQSPKPVNGVYKGVVEVGASGFNAFVINMDKDKNWEMVSKEFDASLAYEGLTNEEDIRQGLKAYLGKMLNRGVASKNLHFVISSGALKEPKTETIASELRKRGYVVNKVTAEQEARYGFIAAVPKEYRDNAYMVDIGSGNSKIAWQQSGTIKTIEGSGAKYFQLGLTDSEVLGEIKRKASSVPESLRSKCFIIGGVPYTLAKQTRNGEERYTLLDKPDKYSYDKDKKLQSGLTIYQGLYETTNSEFIFDWDANFTIGLLLSLN